MTCVRKRKKGVELGTMKGEKRSVPQLDMRIGRKEIRAATNDQIVQ